MTSRTPLLVLALLLGLAITACARVGASDPSDALLDALQRTAGEPFAYTLTFEVDEEALADLDRARHRPPALPTVTGRVVDDASSATISLGDLEVASLIFVEGREVYARLAPGALALSPHGDLADVAGRFADLPGRLGAIASAVLDGDWLAVTVDEDTFRRAGLPAPILDRDELGRRLETHVGDPAAFIREHVTVSETVEDGVRVLHLDVASGDAAEALSGFLAELAPGSTHRHLDAVPQRFGGVTVHVADGRVQRVEVDLTEVARAHGEEVDGTATLVIDLYDHGDVERVTAPDGALELTADEVSAALTFLQRELHASP